MLSYVVFKRICILASLQLGHMVARYGHAVDLFFTPHAHVNHVYVRT